MKIKIILFLLIYLINNFGRTIINPYLCKTNNIKLYKQNGKTTWIKRRNKNQICKRHY